MQNRIMNDKYKDLIFFIKNYVGRKSAINKYHQLIENSKLSTAELEVLTLSKLKKIFIHAKKNVPYYQRVFADIGVDDINSLKDWNKLPILTKSDIKENFNDLIANNISKNRLKAVTTGGSTGTPMTVLHDKNHQLDVLGWRVLDWWGVRSSDNIAFIYRKVKTGWRSVLNAFIWFPTKRLFLDASLMSDSRMNQFMNNIIKTRPKIIQGYVGGVFEFAKHCKRKGIDFDFVQAVWVTSAPLVESQRILMEEIFNAPVYDQYGCSEVYWLAVECSKKKGLHVLSDERFIEVINEMNQQEVIGQSGELAVTDLENYAFPLIRYKNGDRGRYLHEVCSCGLPFPLIDKVKGRVTDIITLPSGKIISGDYLTTIFDDYPMAVEEFQIMQYKDYSIRLFCVLGKTKNANEICFNKVENLKKLTSYEVDINLHVVDNINHIQGKTRFIISEIK